MSEPDRNLIDRERNAYRRVYDTGVSALLSEIWGGNLHLGLFTDPLEPLAEAQLRLKDYMASAAGLRPGQKVLEAACGVGSTALHLARSHGVRVHATNIAEVQLAEAAERAAAAGLSDQVTFAFADYHDIGGSANEYDCWWCQEALLYAADRDRVFSEAARVLKPEGRMVFTDLTLSRELSAADRESFSTDIRAPHLWDMADYDRLIANRGLRLIERRDWSSHVASTFAAVARNLAGARDRFTSIGDDVVRGVEFRITRQLDMARAGYLGWCFFALEV